MTISKIKIIMDKFIIIVEVCSLTSISVNKCPLDIVG